MKTAKIVLWLIITIFTVTAGSFISVNLWSEKDEEITPAKKIVITPDMTVEKMLSINSIPREVIVKVLGPDIIKNPEVTVSEITEDSDKLGRDIEKAQALYDENQTKNWFKIPLKFAVWFIFMGGVFFLLRGKSLSPGRRRIPDVDPIRTGKSHRPLRKEPAQCRLHPD